LRSAGSIEVRGEAVVYVQALSMGRVDLQIAAATAIRFGPEDRTWGADRIGRRAHLYGGNVHGRPPCGKERSDMFKFSVAGAAAVLALSLMLVGCGAQPGKTTLTYGRGKTPPPLAKAEVSGVYKLYPSNGTTPLYTASLNKGDEYGFVMKGQGKEAKAYGYADGREIPLEGWLTTSYYWKRQDEK
jgi:hypothetical protein